MKKTSIAIFLVVTSLVFSACSKQNQISRLPESSLTEISRPKLSYELVVEKDGKEYLESKEYGFKVRVPTNQKGEKLIVGSNENGWSFTSPAEMGMYFAVWVDPPNEQDSKMFLSYLAQKSVRAAKDSTLIQRLPKEYSFYNTPLYSGYATTNFDAVYLLINGQIWTFVVTVEEGDSKGDETITPLKMLVNSFKLDSPINKETSDAKHIPAEIQKILPPYKAGADNNTYRILDLIEFQYRSPNTVESYGNAGVWVSDHQPTTSPQAGTSLNFLFVDRFFQPRDCIDRRFLTGYIFICGKELTAGRSYIQLTHKGKKIEITFPTNRYADVISSLKLVD